MAPTNIGLRVDEDLAVALAAEVARTGATISDVVRGPLTAAYCAPRPTYGPGSSFSFVRDAVDVADHGAAALEASRRLAAFQAQFAANTSNASAVVAPGFLPLVAAQNPDRPLQALCTSGDPITSSNPFGLPGAISGSGVTTAVEGASPTSGTLAVPGANVVPVPISGVFDLSRELADAASPAADAVAFTAMADDYARQTEAIVAAEIVATTAGTISSGLVPSGAQVATTANAGVVAADLKKLIARAVKLRRRRLRAVAATADTTFAEALAAGLDETTGDDTALWKPMGTPVNLSPDLASSSGSTAVVGAAPDSMWCWESAVQRFEYRQGLGVGVVRLAVFGYFAVRAVRPSGIAALRVS